MLLVVLYFLTKAWLPLGPEHALLTNLIFVLLLVGFVLGILQLVVHNYPRILTWCLNHKWQFLCMPAVLVLVGFMTWLGFNKVFGFVANGAQTVNWNIRQTSLWGFMNESFPGVGKEFMPTLDEGSFLTYAYHYASFRRLRRTLKRLNYWTEW